VRLKHDEPPSNSGSNFNLRRYMTVEDMMQGAERTKNGVGVGSSATSVLNGLRQLMGSGGGDGGGFGGIGELNKKQGVPLSQPPT
jgi:hypothetical protein